MPSRVAASRGYFIMDPTIGNAKTVKIIVEIWSVFFLGLNFFWPVGLYKAGILALTDFNAEFWPSFTVKDIKVDNFTQLHHNLIYFDFYLIPTLKRHHTLVS